MKQAPQKPSTSMVALLSVSLAVLLWFVASRFEDDTRWLPDMPRQEFDSTLPETQTDSALRTNTDARSCQQAEADIVSRVDESRYCSTDDDCTLFDYGYPIQCLTSVSKSEITALRLEYRRYEESCEYRVYYDCPAGNSERQPVCRNSRCEVDIVTDDPLKNMTLRHLGLESP